MQAWKTSFFVVSINVNVQVTPSGYTLISKKHSRTVPIMSHKNQLRSPIHCKIVEPTLTHYHLSLPNLIHYQKSFPILIQYRWFREKMSTINQIWAHKPSPTNPNRVFLRRKTPNSSRLEKMTILGFGLRREAMLYLNTWRVIHSTPHTPDLLTLVLLVNPLKYMLYLSEWVWLVHIK